MRVPLHFQGSNKSGRSVIKLQTHAEKSDQKCVNSRCTGFQMKRTAVHDGAQGGDCNQGMQEEAAQQAAARLETWTEGPHLRHQGPGRTGGGAPGQQGLASFSPSCPLREPRPAALRPDQSSCGPVIPGRHRLRINARGPTQTDCTSESMTVSQYRQTAKPYLFFKI